MISSEEGSGCHALDIGLCYPLFSYREKNGRREIVSPLIFTDVADKELPPVYFAAVERRGITSFGDRPKERPQCTDDFGAVTKTDRVRDLADAISALRKQPWAGKVYIVGHSEGVDVAAGVARLLGDDAVAGLALLSGGGPTQFFDFVMEARHNKDDKRVQATFDDMISVTGPQAEGKLNGLPIKRWKTFALDSTPLDDLRGLRLPVFVAQGTLDVKSYVEGADLLVLELLRNATRPVRYLMLPDSDHDFMSADGKVDQSGRVVKDFLRWVTGSKPERSVQMGF